MANVWKLCSKNNTLQEKRTYPYPPQKMGIFESMMFPTSQTGGICKKPLEGISGGVFSHVFPPRFWDEGLNHLGVLEPEMSFEVWPGSKNVSSAIWERMGFPNRKLVIYTIYICIYIYIHVHFQVQTAVSFRCFREGMIQILPNDPERIKIMRIDTQTPHPRRVVWVIDKTKMNLIGPLRKGCKISVPENP